MCGAGAIFFIDSTHFISLKYAAGQGTNNQAEYLALWLPSPVENRSKQIIKILSIIWRLQDADGLGQQ